MKRASLAFTVLLALAVTTAAIAQPPEGQRGRGRGRGQGGRPDGPPGEGFRPPPNPLFEALDANGDRQLSADEIKNATAALAKLDKNNDGKLTVDELRPEGFGRGGRGGPEGPGGRGFGGRGPGARGPGGRGPEGQSGDRPDGPGRPGGDRPARPAAEGAGGGDFVARLLQRDENKDGQLTKDELPERLHSIFARADSNGDDVLDKAEIKKMAERFGGRSSRGNRGGEDNRPERPKRPGA